MESYWSARANVVSPLVHVKKWDRNRMHYVEEERCHKARQRYQRERENFLDGDGGDTCSANMVGW